MGNRLKCFLNYAYCIPVSLELGTINDSNKTPEVFVTVYIMHPCIVFANFLYVI